MKKKRIENLGGRIIYYGTWRVEGVLAVTRAIGDKRLKNILVLYQKLQKESLRMKMIF